MKKIIILVLICIFSLSYHPTILFCQQPVYPIILIHGLKSDDTTWDEFANFLNRGNIDWGPKQVFHVTLNADHQSTKVDGDVISYPGNSISTGSLYSPNFFTYRDQTQNWHFYEYENFYIPNTLIGDSESNWAAIVKQGLGVKLLIDEVINKTGAEKVILVGHSMGGLAAREYLQRLDKAERPQWWVDPVNTDGHKVAKLVTIGTPHLGSNAGEFLGLIFDGQLKSEAVRDLRYSYGAFDSFDPDPQKDVGVYLFGGNEASKDLEDFFNSDVNCNGKVDDAEGINSSNINGSFNHILSLPQNILYTWVVSDNGGFGQGDNVVRLSRQYLYNIGDTLMTNKKHGDEPEDSRSLIRALDEPDSRVSAYNISLSKLYNGFSTFRTNNLPGDTDWFKFSLNDPGTVKITVSNVTTRGTDLTTTIQLIDEGDLTIKASGNNSGGLNTIQFHSPMLLSGEYFLKIVGTPDASSWKNPYSFKLDFIGSPSALIVYSSMSAIPADGAGLTTINAVIRDESGNLIPTATNSITFNITSGAASAQLNGPNPATPVNGVAQITLQSTTTPGMVIIEASSPGLTGSSTTVVVYDPGSETEVSGTISSSTTWTLANSPYVVTGDVTVARGVSLTIEPGVLAKFNSGRDLFVYGSLIADGLPNQRISFTSALSNPTANSWGGIKFYYTPGGAASILDNCNIEYGGQGGFGNLDAPIVLDARVNPQINNTKLEYNRFNGINLVTGTYSANIRLDVIDIPYVFRGDLTMAGGAVLTVAAGVLLKFANNADFYINGGLNAAGNATSPIVFTSLRDDSRGGDTNGDGSTSGTVGDWGGIWFSEFSDDSNSIIRNCEIYFAGQGGFANLDSPISLDARANPTITNTVLRNNRYNGINLKTGTYSANILLDVTGLSYMIRGDLTIASGATLTVRPGVVLKFGSGNDFYVNGGLIASGTPGNHIVFTSIRDDSRGGDSNGDGGTAGSSGDWGGIRFSATTDDDSAILRNCGIYFSGKGGYNNNNSPIVLDARANPIVENVTLGTNRVNGIWIINQTYQVNIKLDITALPYILGGDLIVAASAELSIHPGTLFKMGDKTDFFVDGTLKAIGTSTQPIIFTSFRDDSHGGDTDGSGDTNGVPGDWGGIRFRDASNDEASVCDYTEFYFAGQGGYGNNDSPLVFDNASPKIQNALIAGTKTNGVRCFNTASPDFGGGSRGSVGSNRFLNFVSVGNKYAVRNDGTANILAKHNYWETTDFAIIDQMIYDFKDDSQLGTVLYDPVKDNPTSVEETGSPEIAPKDFVLYQNYPNPFNPETIISFQIPGAEQVTLKIYNTQGQELRTLIDGFYKSGIYRSQWNGKDNNSIIVGSGVYFYQLRAGDFAACKKLVLVR